MSATAPPLHRPPDQERPGRDWRQRRARRSGAAQAVVVRGEPMLWLTAGALGLCLFMIVGLLTLVVVQGLSTFWPSTIVRLTLRDGRTVMGEVARTETYVPEGTPRPIERHLIRTGNFELTGTHFQWISEAEIASDGRSEPQWAVVLERNEWGRFYGEPTSFAIRQRRPISSEEAQLLSSQSFFEKHAAHADPPLNSDQLLQGMRTELAEVRRESTAAFVEKLRRSEAGELFAVLDSGETVPLPERTVEQTVAEIVRRFRGAETAWRQYREHHAAVREVFDERRALEGHEFGELHRRMEEARLAVRKAELQHDLADLLERVEQTQALREQIATLEQQHSEADRIVGRIRRRYGAMSPLAAAAEAIRGKLSADLEAQLADAHARREELEAPFGDSPASVQSTIADFFAASDDARRETDSLLARINALKEDAERYRLGLRTGGGDEKEILLADIVRGYPANQLDWSGRLGVYFSRWGEFLTDDPREANSEGGVWPAIWGTLMMTVFMSLAVVPFGVLAALYLREYAKAGFIVSAVRIAVNNLAGVPSIVFGVFGLGFFCYIIGAYIDGGPRNANLTPWPSGTWLTALIVLAVLAAVGFVLGLYGLTHRKAEASAWQRWSGRASVCVWLTASVLLVILLAKNPYFEGFYAEKLPNPTFGKGALVWASLTLALMTLPVVIVATEEALAAVPNSMREGSYACGASKWQTIRRIVLPRALPGIMTGMILAMARGAGEVAPLMLVGAMKLAPELPLDGVFPFVHLDRSFMHLGFHIYDLGFQSQNSEAAKPMVFTTTLLLIALIGFLNLTAVWLRGRLRRRFQSAQF